MARPKNVRLFEWLMYGSLVVGAVLLLLNPQDRALVASDFAAMRPRLFVLAVLLIAAVVLVLVLLIWLAARRRKNWARWVLTVTTFSAFLPAAWEVVQTLGTDPAGVVLQLVPVFMQTAACVLLFAGDARAWFRRGREPGAVAAEFS